MEAFLAGVLVAIALVIVVRVWLKPTSDSDPTQHKTRREQRD